MAGPTMAELITQVRRRADMENATFVTDDEVQEYLNDSIAELFTELMARWGEEYFTNEEEVTVTAGDGDEDGIIVQITPTPFADPPLRILGVYLWLPDDKRLVPLQSFNRNTDVVFTEAQDWASSHPRYHFNSIGALEFDRATNADRSVMVRVVPAPPRYDKDVATPITGELHTWREFVILDGMIKCLAKEESDTAPLEARKASLLARMSANAPPRDAAKVKLLCDDRAMQDGGDWGF